MIRLTCPSCGQTADGPDSLAKSEEICYRCNVPLQVDDSASSPRKRSLVLTILAFLNLINAAIAGFVSFDAVTWPHWLAREWGIFVGLTAAGMLGFSICLLLRPKYARIAAVMVILLLVLQAVMVVILSEGDRSRELLLFITLVGTAVFAILPLVSLIILSLMRRAEVW
jgi:peptidoglycan/LPS O-acetylase OafA/YrhL